MNNTQEKIKEEFKPSFYVIKLPYSEYSESEVTNGERVKITKGVTIRRFDSVIKARNAAFEHESPVLFVRTMDLKNLDINLKEIEQEVEKELMKRI